MPAIAVNILEDSFVVLPRLQKGTFGQVAQSKPQSDTTTATDGEENVVNDCVFEDGGEIISADEIDEAVLEAEYQQQLMQNAVPAEVIDQRKLQGRDNKSSWLFRRGCPSILVLLAFYIVLPLPQKDPERITNSPTESPTPVSEFDFLVDLLEPISGNNLFVDGSAQNQAFEWLLNEDPAMLDIKSTTVSTLIYRYAMATFYYATDGPNWNDDFNFLSESSVCDWNIQRRGLVCFDDSEEPMSFFFNGINMNGTIPVEISALSTLTLLSLVNDVSLVGTIPTEIGLMTRLTLLQFYQTGMSGSLPASLSALSLLATFVVSTNNFSGTIPDIFQNPSNSFEHIFLQHNDFEGTLPPLKPQGELSWFLVNSNERLTGTLPESLYLQPNLEWMELGDTGIGGRIGPEISELTNMAFIQADRARLSGPIPTTIGNLDLLEELLLSENVFTGTLPSQLGQLDRLAVLHLDGNDFSGTIPNELARMREIEVFRLNGNSKLSGSVPSSFAEELRELREFKIEGTNITSGLAESYCELDVLTTFVSADCGGEDPLIPCGCCVECCEEGEDCLFDITRACNVRADAFVDEERGATCICTPDGTNYTCQETCNICNADGSTCAQTTGYGFELDPATGDNGHFFNVYEYTLGEWDDVIEFHNDIVDTSRSSCEVYVNGLRCATCTESTCGNGFNGYSVDCSNLRPEFTFRSCFPDYAEPNALDVFRYLDPSFINDTTCQPIFPYE